jgi:hypothetical protein
MKTPKGLPYDTRLNVLLEPLTVVCVDEVAATVTHPWVNPDALRVSDSAVRMGVLKGEYHWHGARR